MRNTTRATLPFHRLALAGLATLAVLAPTSAAEDGLSWDGKAQRELEKMLGKVKEKSDTFKVDIDGFAVRTETTAEFAAELALYLERLDGMYRELFPGRPTVGNICEVVVHADQGDYDNMVKAMQVMTGGKSRRAEFVWSWDNQDKRIQSYGLHLHATADETLADIPRDELNGAFLRCFNQRLVGWNPIAPWFELGVTTWMGEFEAEKSLAANLEEHPPTWKPAEPFDPKVKPSRKAEVLGPLLEAERAALARDPEKQRQCASFLHFLVTDKAGNKTLKAVVDDMTKSRPVEIKDKDAVKLERSWLESLAAE